jgi:P2-related tail formation protein
MISAVSRTGRIGTIDVVDVDRAIEWLREAESTMPDAFRAMIGRSDHQILEELYNHLVALYNMAKQNPIDESRLWSFLTQRVPSDKVQKILEAAERSNMITRIGGTDKYTPRPRTEFSE